MHSLSFFELNRYKEKIKYIGDLDPYDLPPQSLSKDPKTLPSIEYPDIVNYFIFKPCPFTKDDLKAYKGLDAYKQFLMGWVRDISSKVAGDKCIVRAKVLHYFNY